MPRTFYNLIPEYTIKYCRTSSITRNEQTCVKVLLSRYVSARFRRAIISGAIGLALSIWQKVHPFLSAPYIKLNFSKY